MGQTSPDNLPFPEVDTDPPDGPAQIQALADAVQTALSGDVNRGVAFQTGSVVTNATGYATFTVDQSKFTATPYVMGLAVVLPQFQGQFTVTRDSTENFPYITLRAWYGAAAKSDVTIQWLAIGA